MEIVSYLIKSIYIEQVIKEIQESFCGLDIFIKDEGHDFYLIQFSTFNKENVNVTDNLILSFDLFFKCMADSIISYERVKQVEQ